MKKKLLFISLFVLLLACAATAYWYYYIRPVPESQEDPVLIEEEPQPVKVVKPKPRPKPEPQPEIPLENLEEPDSLGEYYDWLKPDSVLQQDVIVEETKIEEVAVPAEAKPVHIPRSKSLFNRSNLSVEILPSNKVYFQSTKGRIESLVWKNDRGEYIESLISYDSKGNKQQELEIGLVDSFGEKRKYAVLVHNKVSTFTLSENKKGDLQESVTEYSITSDLKFLKGKTYIKVL